MTTVRVGVGGERLGPELHAEARAGRRPVAAALDDERLHHVLVEVVGVLDHAVVEAAADGDVVEHREVLHVLAQADAAGVRAHRHAVLGGQQQHGDHLVDPAEAAAVELARRRWPRPGAAA